MTSNSYNQNPGPTLFIEMENKYVHPVIIQISAKFRMLQVYICQKNDLKFEDLSR